MVNRRTKISDIRVVVYTTRTANEIIDRYIHDGTSLAVTSRTRLPPFFTYSSRRARLVDENPSMAVLLLSFLLLTALISVYAEDSETVCFCSPREYFFKLNLTATCPPLPPPYPPNDVFGAGVNDYTCSIGPEPVPSGNSNSARTISISSYDSNDEAVRRLIDETLGFSNNPPVDDWILSDITDRIPVVIDSIQFFEVDPQFNVINQDPGYVRNVEFLDGDVFNYTSISDLISTSTPDTNSIPGGMNMVLRGRNSIGERVRNVFTITYTNTCGIPTFEVGDAIGWVIFDELVPATKESCGSQSPSSFPTPIVETPQPSPPDTIVTSDLTNPPSKNPTVSPSQSVVTTSNEPSNNSSTKSPSKSTVITLSPTFEITIPTTTSTKRPSEYIMTVTPSETTITTPFPTSTFTNAPTRRPSITLSSSTLPTVTESEAPSEDDMSMTYTRHPTKRPAQNTLPPILFSYDFNISLEYDALNKSKQNSKASKNYKSKSTGHLMVNTKSAKSRRWEPVRRLHTADKVINAIDLEFVWPERRTMKRLR